MHRAPQKDEVLWRKSTRSAGNGACVEVADLPGAVAVRDTKDPGGPVLSFDVMPWTAFVRGIQLGKFDLSQA